MQTDLWAQINLLHGNIFCMHRFLIRSHSLLNRAYELYYLKLNSECPKHTTIVLCMFTVS